MVVALAQAVVDLLLDVPAIEPVELARLVNAYHADRVPPAQAEVLPAAPSVLRPQVRVALLRVQQVQGAIRTLDRPSRLYHHSSLALTVRSSERDRPCGWAARSLAL